MRLTVVLNGGLKTCCSTYSSKYVLEVIKGWVEGTCSVALIDARKEEWEPDDMARLAIEYFGQEAYPFVYIDDLLMEIGRISPKEELITMLSGKPKRGITLVSRLISSVPNNGKI
ncbi:MAG: hypothetical protein JRJ29_17220 [Deltaproteobacteria bacterium]|nr:hypothetical protein [Deltaproteobacteria bacterium]